MFLFPVLYISNTFLSILANPSNADFWIKVIDVSTPIPFKLPFNVDNGHISVTKVKCCCSKITSLYGLKLSAHCKFSFCFQVCVNRILLETESFYRLLLTILLISFTNKK